MGESGEGAAARYSQECCRTPACALKPEDPTSQSQHPSRFVPSYALFSSLQFGHSSSGPFGLFVCFMNPFAQLPGWRRKWTGADLTFDF